MKMKSVFCAVVMLLVTASSIGAMVVARYSFDDPAKLWRDDSGNGYNLSASPEWPNSGTGMVGGAADFNGTSQGLRTPNGIMPVGSFSLTLWVRFDTVRVTMLSRSFANNSGYTVNVAAYDEFEYSFQTLNSSGASVARPRYVVPVNQWQHLAMTFEALSGPDGSDNYTGTLRGYIDGNLEVTLENAKYKSITTNSQCIGARSGVYLDGMMDEYTLYSGVLSGTEIAAMAVPEPATLAMLALGSLIVMRRRR